MLVLCCTLRTFKPVLKTLKTGSLLVAPSWPLSLKCCLGKCLLYSGVTLSEWALSFKLNIQPHDLGGFLLQQNNYDAIILKIYSNENVH